MDKYLSLASTYKHTYIPPSSESKPHYTGCFENIVMDEADFTYLQHFGEVLLDNSELNPALVKFNAQLLWQ